MKLEVLKEEFSVCKVVDYSQVDWTRTYTFTGKTDEEYSLVCPTDAVPQNVIEREDFWKAFRIVGILDFSLVGILARIAKILADHSISIYAVSTYNTDYVLIKSKSFEHALAALKNEGYSITE